MATGDLKGSLRKLEQGLRLLNYPRDVDYTGSFVKGDPAAFLPIISYSFTSFSTYIAELLVESDVELTAKSDLRFIEAIYKLLRDQFQYKPVLTKQQFLQCGFAERKIQIVCDIISAVMKKHKELSNMNKAKSQTRKKNRSLKSESQANCEKLLADPVICRTVISQQKPQVERHPNSEVNMHGYNTAIPVNEDSEEESCVADDVLEVVCEQATEDNSQIELLKSQLADCQEKLHKLNWMEGKLHVLEERLKGKVIIDEKDWNNLLSRVLLLETELLLQSKKSDLSTEFNNMSEDHTSSRNMTPVSPDIERKEEMPESLHQSSGYSSLLSTDPSPKAATINYHGLTEISKETTRQRMERISKIAGLRTMVYILLETLQLGLAYSTQETFIHTILPSVLFNKT
ncbi:centrosomal protein of 44 kDa isoform X1 [Chelonoidis abingdonii]|uniref:centrosomal protein of 44 kDa isoform X1 n=1 Tax=Chelonoidis abingdonii TaxID=106734 RepID=UPI0013F1BECD|nr:centrosomal protein of 44 kDa isoform X1 [Chelonoidis abingdonii]XP_032636071.1 centrosomal protein of 44 kDa isoform X1 [Chelonoidis abingdonii]XP_032636072.1 centrosomal protein of 44 kDa isoform X1 [Chelonoidis abingdonii]XP_032636074.1 centrosomal protein of 44 kDa isoform X1 [Chelonoidis abingdonii]XP_032636075.1 centrosomal protein of 44 kDa isoform X1 [Chelonoidis abingdonii]XP_032636076.1 centrosomal protein of 44 kDa isoform X1 [Chelonoidis abingdonii]